MWLSLSDLRKVWIRTAPTGLMNGRRRVDVTEHLSEAELNTMINEARKADEAEESLVPCRSVPK